MFRLNAPVVIRVKGQQWGDETETGDETEGTPGCRQEADVGEVRCSRACMGESPFKPLGGNHSAGPWQS